MDSINEGIIPMNMNWRAGINNDTGSNISSNTQPNYQQVPNKGELYQSIVGEAMYIVHMFITPYINKPINETELIIVKSSIQNKLNETIGRYRKFIGNDFPDYASSYISESELGGVITKQYILDCFKSYINPITFESPQSMICD